MRTGLPWQLELGGLVLVAGVVLVSTRVRAVDAPAAGAIAAAPADAFTQPTIDIGCFVSDPEASVKFYTEAIGFREVGSFSVPGPFCKETGLTDGQPLNDIRVLALGEGTSATKLKLSSIPGHAAKRGATENVSAQYGFRYITIHVADTNAALARLKKAGVKPMAKGPGAIPADIAAGAYLTCVQDPDGNIIELVGPKK
jgi:catechol 2,3-dioxygenase-like lactoylglutathione lyase family enzyme